MRLREYMVLFLAIAATAGAAAWLLRAREPQYQGKSLSYWIDELRYNEDQASVAIRAMGPDAADSILRWVRHIDSPIRKLWGSAWQRLPAKLQHFIPQPAVYLTHDLGLALGMLDARAVPRLITALHDPDDGVRAVALEGLLQMKPPAEAAVPEVIRLLDDPLR